MTKPNRYFDTTRKGNHSSFLTPTVVGGRRPFYLNFALKVTHPLRQISAYNISTVRDSETSSIMTNRKSTTGFPTSYRWSAYVTPKSPKGGSKNDFFVFFLYKKFNFNRIKVATKFHCVQTSSGKVVFITIPHLTVHIYIGTKHNP